MTSVQPIEDVLEELEFDIPCRFGEGNPADWIVRVAHMHSKRQCLTPPAPGNMCESHKSLLEKFITRNLGKFCPHCGFHYAGQLSDHFRAIRL